MSNLMEFSPNALKKEESLNNAKKQKVIKQSNFSAGPLAMFSPGVEKENVEENVINPSKKSNDRFPITVAEFARIYAPKDDKNDPEKYASDLVSLINKNYNLNIDTTSNIFDIDTDKLVQTIPTLEGFNQSEEYNLEKFNKPQNLSQEFNNPGMLKFRNQDNSSPAREVRTLDTNKLLYEQGEFAKFDTIEDGYRALEKDIMLKQKRAKIQKLHDEAVKLGLEDTVQANIMSLVSQEDSIRQEPVSASVAPQGFLAMTAREGESFVRIQLRNALGSVYEAAGTTNPRDAFYKDVRDKDGNKIYSESAIRDDIAPTSFKRQDRTTIEEFVPEITVEEARRRTRENETFKYGLAMRQKAQQIYKDTPRLQMPENMVELEGIGMILEPQFWASLIGQQIPQMILTTGVGFATSLASGGNIVAGTAAAMATTGILEGGLAYDEARKYGLEPDEADDVLMTVGMFNALIESAPSGMLLKKLGIGKGLEKEFVRKLIEKGVTKETLKEGFAQGVTEAATETLQEFVNIQAELKYLDENDLPLPKDISNRLLQSGLSGFFVGDLLGTYASFRNIKKEIQNIQTFDLVVNALENNTLNELDSKTALAGYIQLTDEQKKQYKITDEQFLKTIGKENIEKANTEIKNDLREKRGIDKDSPVGPMVQIEDGSYINVEDVIDAKKDKIINSDIQDKDVEDFDKNTDTEAKRLFSSSDLDLIDNYNGTIIEGNNITSQVLEAEIGKEFTINNKKYELIKTENDYVVKPVQEKKDKRTNQEQLESSRREVLITREENAKYNIKLFEANTPSVRNKQIDSKIVSELKDISKELNLPIVKKGKRLNKNELRNQIKEFYDKKEQDVAQKETVEEAPKVKKDFEKTTKVESKPKEAPAINDPEKLKSLLKDESVAESLLSNVEAIDYKTLVQAAKGLNPVSRSKFDLFQAIRRNVQKKDVPEQKGPEEQIRKNKKTSKEKVDPVRELETTLSNEDSVQKLMENPAERRNIPAKVVKDLAKKRNINIKGIDNKIKLLDVVYNDIKKEKQAEAKKGKKAAKEKDIKEFKESLPNVSEIDKLTNSNWNVELNKALEAVIFAREQFKKGKITEKNLIAAENNFTISKKLSKKFATPKQINDLIKKYKAEIKKSKDKPKTKKKIVKKKDDFIVEQPKAYNEIRFKSTYKGKSEDRIHRKKDDGSWEFEVLNEEGNLEFVPIKSKAIIAKANKKLTTKDKDIEDAQRKLDEQKDEEAKKDMFDFLVKEYKETGGGEFAFMGITPQGLKMLKNLAIVIGKKTYGSVFKRGDNSFTIDSKINLMSIAGIDIIRKGAKNLKQFKNEMVNKFDNSVIRYIKKIYKGSKDYLQRIFKGNQRLERDPQESILNAKKEDLYFYPKDDRGFRKKAYDILSPYGAPISERLDRINPMFKKALIDYQRNIDFFVRDMNKLIAPFLKKYKNLTMKEQRVLDSALYTGELERINKTLDRYDLREEYKGVKEAMDTIFKQANDAGMDLSFVENYFPRQVIDPGQYYEYLYEKEMQDKPEVIASLDRQYKRKEREFDRELTLEEKITIINKTMESFRKMPGIKNKNHRTVGIIDVENIGYYKMGNVSIVSYIENMARQIEKQKFFGKNANINKDLTNSIGAVVNKLVQQNKLNEKQKEEAKAIFQSYFNKQNSNYWVSSLRKITYMSTLGQFTSLLGTTSEIGANISEFGVFNFAGVVIDKMRGKKLTTIEDIGIEKISQDLSDAGDFKSDALKKIFAWNGFAKADRLLKETYINSAIRYYQKQAKKIGKTNEITGYDNFSKKQYKMQLEEIFGVDEQGNLKSNVIQHLKDGVISNDVLTLAYSKLLEIQPVADSELTTKYMDGGGFYRLWSQLKTWQIKMFSFQREKLRKNLSIATTKRQKALAWKESLQSVACLAVAGAAGDEIRDWFKGEDNPFKEHVWDNALSIFMLSSYKFERFSRSEFFENPTVDFAASGPIVSLLNDALLLARWKTPIPLLSLTKKMEPLSMNENEHTLYYGLKSIRHIPFVGGFAYYGHPGIPYLLDKHKGMGGYKSYVNRKLKDFEAELGQFEDYYDFITTPIDEVNKKLDYELTEQQHAFLQKLILEKTEIDEYEGKEVDERFDKIKEYYHGPE